MKNKKNNLQDSKQQASTTYITQKQNKKDNSINKAPEPVLGKKAEDYLREQANIEDMPDEKDMTDYDKKIEEEKRMEKD